MLKQYPDDYIVCIDNVFGWETVHRMEDPHLYVNTDIGQIEIEPEEYRELDDAMMNRIINIAIQKYEQNYADLTEEVRKEIRKLYY